MTVAFEPLFPLSHSLYQCDNRFHAEALEAALLDARAGDRARHGFVVVDGSGVLLAALEGAAGAPRVLHRFSVDLPRKHGRGGQSALRFGRLREEARHNYVRRVAEAAQECFIDKKSSQVNKGQEGIKWHPFVWINHTINVRGLVSVMINLRHLMNIANMKK